MSETENPDWKFYEGYGEKGDQCLIVREAHGFFPQRRIGLLDNSSKEENASNAAKIVKCVNLFPKLVEMLGKAVEDIEWANDAYFKDICSDLDEMKQLLEEAK